MFQKVYLTPNVYVATEMGETGRPWTAMIALLAMAILMAFAGPRTAAVPPVSDVARATMTTAPRALLAAPVVDSR